MVLMIHYRIQRQELRLFFKSAKRAAFRGKEVCGLLVRLNNRLLLIPVTNATKEPGSFWITPRYWLIALAANQLDSKQVEGTYHSHPFSPAEPGEGDIASACQGSLMLIFSCWDNEARLWRIQDGKAKPVRFLRSIA